MRRTCGLQPSAGAGCGPFEHAREEVLVMVVDVRDVLSRHPDIEDDLVYLDLFIAELEQEQILARPPNPPNPWPRD